MKYSLHLGVWVGGDRGEGVCVCVCACVGGGWLWVFFQLASLTTSRLPLSLLPGCGVSLVTG